MRYGSSQYQTPYYYRAVRYFFDTIQPDNQWHQYSYTFTFSGSIPHNAIAVYTGTSSSSESYVYVDDISLISLNGGSFTLPANLCAATVSLPNLNAYLNGIPTGGVFAGPSVSQTGPNAYSLNDLFDMNPGIATISYTYTNSSGFTRTRPQWLLVTHMFNHQTHHRGQLTTLLNQMGYQSGVTDLPAMMDEN